MLRSVYRSYLLTASTGYSSIRAQLLSVPPYAAAAVLTVTVGFIADRTRQRGLCNIAVSFLGMIGFAMLLGCESAGARYAGTFLGAMGIYPAIANTISWTSNNTEGNFRPEFRSYLMYMTKAKTNALLSRCIQTRCLPRVYHRLGKPQRHRLIQHLPRG